MKTLRLKTLIKSFSFSCALASFNLMLLSAPVSSTPPPVQMLSSTVQTWTWPLSSVHLMQPFRAPETPYSPGHRGIDLEAIPQENVTAPTHAKVYFVGTVVDRPLITLDHGNNILSTYEPVSSSLSTGEEVSQGQLLGTVAEGGHCKQKCLHIGIRINQNYVSPLLFFDKVPYSSLLPQL